MNNNDDIEILDDLDLDVNETNQELSQNGLQYDTNQNAVNQNIINPVQNNENSEETLDLDTKKDQSKEEIENPVVEMINNKSTMRLIIIILVILFIAVFLMPKFFELING